MPNFSRVDTASARFPGDFSIQPIPGYASSAAEQAYVDAVEAVVDALALDAANDFKAGYPDVLHTSRQDARSKAIAALRLDVEKFIGGQNAAADVAGLDAIQSRYTSEVPKFGTRDSAQPRFDGDFDHVVVHGYVPEPDEVAFLEAIDLARNELAEDKLIDTATSGFSQAVVELRIGLRKAFARDLRRQVESYPETGNAPKAAAEKVLVARGQYQAKRDRLGKRLFNAYFDKDNLVLEINLFSGLAAPHDVPSSDKLDLYVSITKTQTVVSTVCDRMYERAEQRLLARLRGPDESLKRRAQFLEATFLKKLHGIAVIGLEREFTAMAKLTLAELRNEFFVREAGRIKNMYVYRLGMWAAAAALIFLGVYTALYTKWIDYAWGHDHKSFLLAACGAAIGTWASFSVRQVQFSFDDLVMVEESALDPPMRILFVIVLTLAACLLFWNGAVNIEIGNLKTQAESFARAGSIALLIGLFCGLSERALATAIAGRAAAFVKGVAGA